MARSASPFLRTLRAALWADAQEEIDLALRVGLMLEYGLSEREMAERVDVDRADIRAAVKRARWARAHLEREERPES